MAEKLDTKLTVRTNSTTKKQFADKAKANGTTPTALINQLMHDYVTAGTTSTNNEDSTTSMVSYTTSTNNEDTNQTQQELEARIEALEDKLVQKCDQSYLYGLSCHLSETPPSDLPLKSTKQDTPYQLTLTDDNPPDEAKFDQSENKAQSSDEEGLSSTELAGLLDIPKGYITNWKKGKNIPSEASKYHTAYQEWLKWELKGGKWQKPTS